MSVRTDIGLYRLHHMKLRNSSMVVTSPEPTLQKWTGILPLPSKEGATAVSPGHLITGADSAPHFSTLMPTHGAIIRLLLADTSSPRQQRTSDATLAAAVVQRLR
jgi:hypothetical protein